MAGALLRYPIANSQACLIRSISWKFDAAEKPRYHVLLKLRLAQRGSVGLKDVSIRAFTLTFRREEKKRTAMRMSLALPLRRALRVLR